MLLRLALTLVIMQVVFSKSPLDSHMLGHWENFKIDHKKAYTSPNEEVIRRYIFEENVRKIQEHNLRADMGHHTFWTGINEYADLTEEEFQILRGYRGERTSAYKPSKLASKKGLPTTVDWRTSGCVTPIKNQKQCGSCWAFSTTGSLESQLCLKSKNKTLISLSEQNLVDCSRKQGNMGCQGGLMDQGFTYIKKNNGIDTEACYPYEAVNGQCRYKTTCVGGHDTGYTDIPTGDENSLQQHVAQVGPISVAIDASGFQFQFYKHGVYNNALCSSTRLDHGVLAVGYGVYQSKDYWLVKNSWGETWGMKGYIMMSRNKKNQCGIATSASFPLV